MTAADCDISQCTPIGKIYLVAPIKRSEAKSSRDWVCSKSDAQQTKEKKTKHEEKNSIIINTQTNEEIKPLSAANTHIHSVVIVVSAVVFRLLLCFWVYKKCLISIQEQKQFHSECSVLSPMCQRHSVRAYVLIETHTVRVHSRLHIVSRDTIEFWFCL